MQTQLVRAECGLIDLFYAVLETDYNVHVLWRKRLSFLGGIALAEQAIPPIPTHFLRSVVWSVCLCLSSFCHICAACLNLLTDLDAIWQVHLCGPMTHCVGWGLWHPRRRGDLGFKPPAKLPNCQFYAATWRIQRRSWV